MTPAAVCFPLIAHTAPCLDLLGSRFQSLDPVTTSLMFLQARASRLMKLHFNLVFEKFNTFNFLIERVYYTTAAVTDLLVHTRPGHFPAWLHINAAPRHQEPAQDCSCFKRAPLQVPQVLSKQLPLAWDPALLGCRHWENWMSWQCPCAHVPRSAHAPGWAAALLCISQSFPISTPKPFKIRQKPPGKALSFLPNLLDLLERQQLG